MAGASCSRAACLRLSAKFTVRVARERTAIMPSIIQQIIPKQRLSVIVRFLSEGCMVSDYFMPIIGGKLQSLVGGFFWGSGTNFGKDLQA